MTPTPVATNPNADLPADRLIPHSLRVDWVDVAKGICIILVVMLHSTLGVEAAMGAEGFMNWPVMFALPFRMPDFFLIAGLFLALTIDKDWRTYLDRKVLHFVYFYVIWTLIQVLLKDGLQDGNWAQLPSILMMAAIQPISSLWFIAILPFFFVVTKMVRNVSPWIVVAIAAALHMAPISTGWILIDEFASRYVFFFIGYWAAPHVFNFAEQVRERWVLALALLPVWAVINYFGAFTMLGDRTIAAWPPLSLVFGLMGGAAVVAIAVMLSPTWVGKALRYAGERSIVVFLAYFVFMAATRIVMLKLGIIADPGLVSVIVLTTAVIGPLIMAAIIDRIGFGGFLFERPRWAMIVEPKKPRTPTDTPTPPAGARAA